MGISAGMTNCKMLIALLRKSAVRQTKLAFGGISSQKYVAIFDFNRKQCARHSVYFSHLCPRSFRTNVLQLPGVH